MRSQVKKVRSAYTAPENWIQINLITLQELTGSFFSFELRIATRFLRHRFVFAKWFFTFKKFLYLFHLFFLLLRSVWQPDIWWKLRKPIVLVTRVCYCPIKLYHTINLCFDKFVYRLHIEALWHLLVRVWGLGRKSGADENVFND